MSLERPEEPRRMEMAERGIPRRRLRKRMRASLALPSTGGAAMRMRHVAPSSMSPATASLEAPGETLTERMQSAVSDIVQFEERGGGEFGEVRAVAGDGDIEPEHAGFADGEVGIADGGAHGGGGFRGDPDGDAAGVGDDHFGFRRWLIVAQVLEGRGLEDAFVFGVDLDAEHGAALDDGAGGIDFVAAGGGGAAGGEADGSAGDGGLGEALFAGDDFEGVENGEGLEDPGFGGEVGFGGDAFDAVGGAGEGDGAVADDREGIGEGFGKEGAEGDGGEGGFGGDFGVFAEADGSGECARAA